MRRNLLSSLSAILLALAIALAGIAVPRLLIRQQTDRLNAKSELLSADQLTPYSAGVDSPVRIRKLANMAAALLSYGGTELYADTREPLDTELSQEGAIYQAASFLADMITTAEDMGLDILANPDYYNPYDPKSVIEAYEYFETDLDAVQKQGKTLADLLVVYCNEWEFCASPEDSSLAMWLLYFGSPYCGCYIMIDAVTGIPIYFLLASINTFYESEYLFAVIHAYQALFPDRFDDFGADVTESFESGIPAARSENMEVYGYTAENTIYYSTQSGEVVLELAVDHDQTPYFTPVFRLYA